MGRNRLQNVVSTLPVGRYVVAVSGGVDSMTLLDLLRKRPDLELVVAHLNHGIRQDSDRDEELVRTIAKVHKLKFEVGYGKLSKNSGEEEARQARYGFLQAVQSKYNASGIVTAHHQDDLLETAILNLLRGSGRRGLTSISSQLMAKRPLLKATKMEIIDYAKDHGLVWHDDSTNEDLRYKRNYIRSKIIPKLSPAQRSKLLSLIHESSKSGSELDEHLANLSAKAARSGRIDRHLFIMLPNSVANELMLYWLREQPGATQDKKTVHRLSNAVKTAKAGTNHAAGGRNRLEVDKEVAFFAKTGSEG